MSLIKRNIIANYLGSALTGLMGMIFIPQYIRYVGIESYGLVGVFTMMLAWFALLDTGITPMFNRELARFQAGAHTPQSIRDLMHTVEMLYLGVVAIVSLTVAFLSHWIATSWVRLDRLPVATASRTMQIMGLVIGARLITSLYRGAFVGLQRQVWLNGCSSIFAILRGAGVLAVLAWISPSIMTFFLYQGALYALEALTMAVQMRRILPVSPRPPKFDVHAVRPVWRFAAGMSALTLLGVLLTQVDKLLLSKMLPLTSFAYYSLASTVAGSLYLVIAPITNAGYPLFTQYVTQNATPALIAAYHKLSQVLALAVVPASIILFLFSERILLLWTKDPVIASATAPFVSLLALGNMLHGLMHTPYILQLAYGWTRLSVVLNIIAVIVLLPALYVGVSAYGAVAATVVWLVLNGAYIFVATPLMHRRLIPAEMWRWFREDVFMPIAAALIAALIARTFLSAKIAGSRFESMALIAAASILTLFASVLALPLGREQLSKQFVSLLRRPSPAAD